MFSSNGQYLATGDEKHKVQLWDARTGTPGLTLQGHKGLVASVVFSSNGQQIASASEDGTVRLWVVESGQRLAVVDTFQETVSCID